MKPHGFDKSALNSLLGDLKVMEQVREVLGQDPHLELMDAAKLSRHRVKAIVETPQTDRGEFLGEEAIVLAIGRPPLLVRNGAWEAAAVAEINERLNAARPAIERAIASVARLELPNGGSVPYLGTAWMIADDVMITNRHVVELFAYGEGNTVRFLSTPLGETYQPQVDFREEYGSDLVFEVPIREVLFLESRAPGLPDLAFVRVEPHEKLPPPIELDDGVPAFKDNVAAIGYPAADGGRNDRLVMEKLFKGIYEVKRLSPGWISGVDMQSGLLMHDCTTLGGSSGSVLVSLDRGKAVGLHFKGEYRLGNYAVPAPVIRDRLRNLTSRGVSVPMRSGAGPGDFGEERPQPTPDDLTDRTGYNPDFLGESVDLPGLSPALQSEFVSVEGSPNGLLNYLHFSIGMHGSRRMALYTACNIDGANEFSIKRTGKDPWVFDPRIDKDLQIGHQLYVDTNLQRGHLVRRLDPCWGPSKDIAKQAELDTFFFSNCTPQHENFNPKTWLSLEEYVLRNAWKKDLKVTVFTGPVLRDTDKTFRGVRMPEEYWKVIVIRREDTGQLSATGYIVSQADWMNDLEFVYGQFETYQIPIKSIEQRTGLNFAQVRPFDPLDMIEARVVRMIRRPEDIRI